MFQPHTFCRFAFPRKSFTLRKFPLCLAVTLKHVCTFGSVLQQYFASEVGRVLSHTCELVWNTPSESDFRLPGDLPLGSQLSPLHFSSYFALVVQILLRCCGSVLTLFLRFSSYSALTSELPLCDCNAASTFVPGFQFLLCFYISVLTRLLRFGSYFAGAFQRSLRFCLSGPAQPRYLRSYSASTSGVPTLLWDIWDGT